MTGTVERAIWLFLCFLFHEVIGSLGNSPTYKQISKAILLRAPLFFTPQEVHSRIPQSTLSSWLLLCVQRVVLYLVEKRLFNFAPLLAPCLAPFLKESIPGYANLLI